MAVELYSHQKAAVEKLRSGSILAGGVGTGKSRTALAYYVTKICKHSLDNLASWNGPDIPLYIITTARKRDTFEWDEECAHFLIKTPWVTIDSWNNIKKYVGVRDAFFIFDEQRLVGSGAWVKAFLQIAKFNKWILLTATPGDCWMDYIPVFIANGFYRNRTEFIARHVVYHRFAKFPKVERYVDTDHLVYLRNKIVVPMDYKKPAKVHHEWVEVGFDEELYQLVSSNRWNVYDDKPIENASEMCYLLRKIVNNDPRRIKEIDKLMKMHDKAIIFYNFDYELELLRQYSILSGITSAEWNGHRHEPIPTTDKWIYLVQYAAGCEGWNCILTDTIIFFSSNYSYRATEQAAGRIDRMNTPFKILYCYHLFSRSSIDRSIKRCLEQKKDFNESTFCSEIDLKPMQMALF